MTLKRAFLLCFSQDRPITSAFCCKLYRVLYTHKCQEIMEMEDICPGLFFVEVTFRENDVLSCVFFSVLVDYFFDRERVGRKKHTHTVK